jgi:hypothetical protein
MGKSKNGKMGTAIGLPRTKRVTMRYVSWVDLAGTSGALGTQIVGAGDLHDPDKTGVGHQPLGYDNWAALYSKYLVVKSTITAEFAQSSTSASVFGIYLSQANGITGTSWEELAEQGRGVHCLANTGSGAITKRLTLEYDAKRLMNLGNVKDNVDRLGGSFGSSPSGDGMYFVIYTQPHDASTTIPVQIAYTIDYDVVVSEPKELVQS